MASSSDREQIDDIVARFFRAFDNRDGRIPSLTEIASVFVPGAIVVHDTGSRCEHCSVSEFAEPRVRLLTDGGLVDFHEWETENSTHVVGRVAARTSRYRKEGQLNGQPYEGGGQKFFQFAEMAEGWRISAVAWSDDA